MEKERDPFFVSQVLGATTSVQFDVDTGALLLAGRSSQLLLDASETSALLEFLYQQRARLADLDERALETACEKQ